jgi:hypothetical protein
MTIRATASAHGSHDVSDLPTVPRIPVIPAAGLRPAGAPTHGGRA